MGLGKTITSFMAFMYLNRKHGYKTVITASSTLLQSWQLEYEGIKKYNDPSLILISAGNTKMAECVRSFR